MAVSPTATDAEIGVPPTRINAQALARELAVRGCGWIHLTKGPHRLNSSTVTKLKRGCLVDELHPATLTKLAVWLRETPKVRDLTVIISEPVEGET